MNIDENELFTKNLYEYCNQLKQEAFVDLHDFSESSVLSINIEEKCSKIVEKYSLNIPALDEPYLLESEYVRAVKPLRHRNNHFPSTHIDGQKVEYVVPFVGDPRLFEYKVEVRNHQPIYGQIIRNELHLTYLLPPEFKESQVEQIDKKFGEDVSLIRKYLIWSGEEATKHNQQLRRQSETLLQQYRENALKVDNVAKKLGLQIKRRNNAPETYKPPVKRLELPIRKSGTTSTNIEPHPLSLEEYEHIIHVLANMGRVMEYSPGAFSKMFEEHLRFHFLVQLNGQYEGQATGETFNLAGKTDILIRIDGHNIFIAECKYWGGEKKLLESIDQLLGYLTWRDTKSAIILFNRIKDFAKVLKQIPISLQRHQSFVELLNYEREGSFRCVLKHPENTDKDVLLTILVFNIACNLRVSAKKST